MPKDVSQTDEEKEVQSETEKTVEDKEEPKEEKATGLIDKADASANRLEELLDRQEKLLNKQMEFDAKRRLAGRGAAGEPAKTKEEVDEEKLDAEAAKSIDRFK